MVQVIKQVGEKRYRESFGRYCEEFTVGRHLRASPGPHSPICSTANPPSPNLVSPAFITPYRSTNTNQGVERGAQVLN